MLSRFILRIDYPNSIFEVGDVIELDIERDCWVCKKYEDVGMKNHPANYPDVFKELDWWEYREIEDMPMYLRDTCSGDVVKVKEHFTGRSGTTLKQWFTEEGTFELKEPYEGFEPATEEEYLKSIAE